jgi:hypothetical protein
MSTKKTMIERTHPMKVHKRWIIWTLENYPQDFRKLAPDWKGDLKSYLKEIQDSPFEWFVGGELKE